jgi:hypothetical protein
MYSFYVHHGNILYMDPLWMLPNLCLISFEENIRGPWSTLAEAMGDRHGGGEGCCTGDGATESNIFSALFALMPP